MKYTEQLFILSILEKLTPLEENKTKIQIVGIDMRFLNLFQFTTTYIYPSILCIPFPTFKGQRNMLHLHHPFHLWCQRTDRNVKN